MPPLPSPCVVLFYTNQIPSSPAPCGLIEDEHTDWRGNYSLLERHHGYIQWWFPIREDGMNSQSQMLTLKERDALRQDEDAQRRLIVSYQIMLGQQTPVQCRRA